MGLTPIVFPHEFLQHSPRFLLGETFQHSSSAEEVSRRCTSLYIIKWRIGQKLLIKRIAYTRKKCETTFPKCQNEQQRKGNVPALPPFSLFHCALPLIHCLEDSRCTLRKQLRSGSWIAWRLSDGFPHLLYSGVFRSLKVSRMGFAPFHPNGNQQCLEYPCDRRSEERTPNSKELGPQRSTRRGRQRDAGQ